MSGVARYDSATKTLYITTDAKRGAKTVKNEQTYLVADICPDKRIADPAYSLTKGAWEADGFEADVFRPSGDVYHVAQTEYGPTCSCAHATFRGANSRVPCKHCLAMQAVGFLPNDDQHQEVSDEELPP